MILWVAGREEPARSCENRSSSKTDDFVVTARLLAEELFQRLLEIGMHDRLSDILDFELGCLLDRPSPAHVEAFLGHALQMGGAGCEVSGDLRRVFLEIGTE